MNNEINRYIFQLIVILFKLIKPSFHSLLGHYQAEQLIVKNKQVQIKF